MLQRFKGGLRAGNRVRSVIIHVNTEKSTVTNRYRNLRLTYMQVYSNALCQINT